MYDIRLVTLMKLIELKNYTKTAKELNFTQPTVTQHIKSLEKEYNIKIFNKDLSLTKSGNMLYEYAKQVSERHNVFTNNLDNLIQTEAKINIGMTECAYHTLLEIGFFQELIKASKNQLSINVMDNESLTRDLINARMDFGFLNKASDHSLIYEYVDSDNLVLAVKANHNLLKKETNPSMKKYILTTIARNNPYYSAVEAYLESHNYSLTSFKNVVETNNIETTKKLVLKHNAIGVFYADSITKELKNKELVIYDTIDTDISVYFTYNKLNIDDEKLHFISGILNHVRE